MHKVLCGLLQCHHADFADFNVVENALTHLGIRTLGLYRLLKLYNISVTSNLVRNPYCLVENKMFIWRVYKLHRYKLWLLNS